MRARHSARWAMAAVFGLIALGCAQPGTRDGDSAPLPSPSTSAPPSRSTQAGDALPPGDGAPHAADNNAWKQRHELAADERSAGDALAARIRPKLAALRSAGDFAAASTERALLGLGLRPEDVHVGAMQPLPGEASAPPAVFFAVRFAGVGCVIGSVRPERLSIEVTGSNPEFGCVEPSTH